MTEICVLCLRQSGQRHNVFYLYVCLSVRSSVLLSVRQFPVLWTWYFENEWTDCDANWQKWSGGKGIKRSTFVQEVKRQDHSRPKMQRPGGGIILRSRVAFLVYLITNFFCFFSYVSLSRVNDVLRTFYDIFFNVSRLWWIFSVTMKNY